MLIFSSKICYHTPLKYMLAAVLDVASYHVVMTDCRKLKMYEIFSDFPHILAMTLQ
jgi:hypothetical protein